MMVDLIDFSFFGGEKKRGGNLLQGEKGRFVWSEIGRGGDLRGVRLDEAEIC